AERMARGGAYHRLMAAQAQDGAGRAEPLVALNSAAPPATGEDESADPASLEPTDAILRAQGMGWAQLIRVLLGMVAGYRARLLITFVLGVARVIALIGVGVLSALIVRAVKNGAPFGGLLIALALAAPLAGVLHWLESWLAHDMAYRLLADMRLDMFRKLDALAPAYLTRRRTGDLAAHAVDSVQGLGEIVAFRQVRARGEEFAAKAREYFRVRMPFLHDLTLQTSLQEIATGIGGLAVVVVGAALGASGRLDTA